MYMYYTFILKGVHVDLRCTYFKTNSTHVKEHNFKQLWVQINLIFKI